MPPNYQMTPTDWALLASLSLLWGGSFFFVKVAVATLSPFTVVLVREVLAAAALSLCLRWRGIPLPRGRAAWGSLIEIGLVNNLIPFTLLFWAETVLSGALASVLVATTPLFSLAFAHLLTTDEKLTALKLVGIGLGVAGVAIMVGVDAVTQTTPAILPTLACLGTALCYGFASVFGRRFRRMGIDPLVGAFGQTAATSVMILPFVLAFAPPWRGSMPDATTWAALVSLGLLSTALAYTIFFRLLATAGAVNTSLVSLLAPVSAILLGGVFLGERLTGPQIGGMLLIGAGLLAIDGRLLARYRLRAQAG